GFVVQRVRSSKARSSSRKGSKRSNMSGRTSCAASASMSTVESSASKKGNNLALTGTVAGRAEPHGMDAHARLAARVAAEQDELLTTLLLCGDDAAIAERLWSQLVDLLVESLFLDLRGAFLA